jgi:hypothetical protein
MAKERAKQTSSATLSPIIRNIVGNIIGAPGQEPITRITRSLGVGARPAPHPFTHSAQRGISPAPPPHGMMGTLEVEFFGEPSIGRSE